MAGKFGMDGRTRRFLDTFVQRQALKRWRRAAAAAERLDLSALRALRGDAQALRRRLDDTIRVADARLTLPQVGSTAMRKPLAADWAWRPELWRGRMPVPGIAAADTGTRLGDEVKLFHDCTVSELTVRQIRNTDEADLAPFGMQVDVFGFDGGFLSLAIDLPPAGLDGLSREHILRVDTAVEMEKPLEIFARLNIRHGSSTEQVVRELPLQADEVQAEFDLAYTGINEKRIEAVWLDLIFEGPEMNRIILRDLTLNRRLRAQL